MIHSQAFPEAAIKVWNSVLLAQVISFDVFFIIFFSYATYNICLNFDRIEQKNNTDKEQPMNYSN